LNYFKHNLGWPETASHMWESGFKSPSPPFETPTRGNKSEVQRSQYRTATSRHRRTPGIRLTESRYRLSFSRVVSALCRSGFLAQLGYYDIHEPGKPRTSEIGQEVLRCSCCMHFPDSNGLRRQSIYGSPTHLRLSRPAAGYGRGRARGE
jgi:hypothetical protein